MVKKLAALSLAIVAGVLVACAGRSGGGNMLPQTANVELPQIGPDLRIEAAMPKNTVGVEYMPEGLGSIKMKFWKTVVGGFTQSTYSQTLAFPPGTKITIRNISKSDTHTLNVVSEVSGPPANFPASPQLSVKAHGKGIFGTGYASGPLAPGKSVTVTLNKEGTYLIGCAYHYKYGMRDIVQVSSKAKPGPQATKPPKPTPEPTDPSTPPSGGGW